MSTNEKDYDKVIKNAFMDAKADAEKIWKFAIEETKEPDPLLFYQDKPVIFKNSIVLVQGKSGVHKSRLTSSLASLLVADDCSKELLGFKSTSEGKNQLIYCDTERNIAYQLPVVIKQIARDAELDIDTLKSKFTILPLMNTQRPDRTRVMNEQFKELRKEETTADSHFIIVLDIISDLVSNFNDVPDTMSLVDLINKAINTIDVTFILVIHENPGSIDKARGHLGTELSNKASTVFQISESTMEGIFKLKMLKSRSTQKYEDIMLQYDSSVNNLVVVTDGITNIKASDPEVLKLCESLAKKLFTTMERNDLIIYLEKDLNWKERKIEDKLKKVIDLGIIIGTSQGNAILTKERGKTAQYKMNYNELPRENISEEEVFGMAI